MRESIYDEQIVLHCFNCGTSFFEDNGINRITSTTAQALSTERTISIPRNSNVKKCPRDFNDLYAITHSEAVPSSITLYSCPRCHGILAEPDDLLKFKKAQAIKIDYLKIWEQPLGSLKTVFAVFIFFFMSAALLWGFNTVQQRQSLKSEASELIKQVAVTKTGPYIFLSFKTKQKVTSEIVMKNLTQNTTTILPISTTPSNTHSIAITSPAPSVQITFHINLRNQSGGTAQTEEQELR